MKTFYQKWWFGLIILIFGFIMVFVVTGNETVDSGASATTEQIDTSEIKPMQEDAYKAACKVYTYEELLRNPEQYKNQTMKFSGEVLKILENGKNVDLLIEISSGEELADEDRQAIHVSYVRKDGESRILKKDKIEVYGSFSGLFGVILLGEDDKIPSIKASYLEILPNLS